MRLLLLSQPVSAGGDRGMDRRRLDRTLPEMPGRLRARLSIQFSDYA